MSRRVRRNGSAAMAWTGVKGTVAGYHPWGVQAATGLNQAVVMGECSPKMRARQIFMFRWRSALLVLVTLLLSRAVTRAQTPSPAYDPHHVDGTSEGTVLNLSSTWLVQEGDDPRYADPALDDRGWLVVSSRKPLLSYGIENPDKVWYRTHVTLPKGRTKMALLIRSFGGSFTIYVNGLRVGDSGPMPEGGSAVAISDKLFSVPDVATQAGDVTIAIKGRVGRRLSAGTGLAGFAPYTVLLFGPAAGIRDATMLYQFRNYTSNVFSIILELLVPFIALALALTLPKEREYMWLAISGAGSVLGDILQIWQSMHGVFENVGLFYLNGILSAVSLIGMLEFVRIVLGLNRSRLWAAYEWFIGILLIVFVPMVSDTFLLGAGGLHPQFLVIMQTLAQLLTLPVSVGLPVLAIAVWWRGRRLDALLLAVPLFLQAAVSYINFGLFVLNHMHITERGSLPPVPIANFNMQWTEVASFLFTVALLMFLVLRTVRIARSRAAMESDLHAVQSVQEILLSRASHATPGFRVEHVYHPAQEVGGDFFLVSPGPDGSLTAILGDVSGKGLVAAMRVSMILGVLRREENREPEAILRNLNDALLMQGEMGFTTACCVRLEPNGRYTIANAGHISPYVGGKEIVTPSSLPLGMAEGQEYEHVVGFLPLGRPLVLMSDGVVEARTPKGELYGFERLPQLTMMAAEDIADVARRFGQEDDITVLTVACEV